VVIRHDDITIDRKSLTISVGYNAYQFRLAAGSQEYTPHPRTSLAFECISHLLLAGHTSDERLFEVCYGSLANGGPIDGPHIMLVHYCNWRHILDKLGLELAKDRIASVTYRFLRTRKTLEMANDPESTD
jgi:hypothetical protein